jgi:hypothetical protein
MVEPATRRRGHLTKGPVSVLEMAFSFLGFTKRSRFGALDPGERGATAVPRRSLQRVVCPSSHTSIHDEKMDSMLTHFSFLVVVFIFAGRSSGQNQVRSEP